MSAIQKQDFQPNDVKNSDEGKQVNKKSVVDLLIEKGVLSKDELRVAVAELERRQDGSRLLDVIIQMGFVPEMSISEIISGDKDGKAEIDILNTYIEPEIIKKNSRRICQKK